VPDRANALDAWLDLLREESPHFQLTDTASDPQSGGWIRNPALASAEYCDVRATRVFEPEQAGAEPKAGHTDKVIAKEPMAQLPELPSRFQNAFEAAKAKAELVYATRADKFPHHPQLADSPLHGLLLIQKVFFEFCKQARDAGREGQLSLAQASKAVDGAWPILCDYYFERERGQCSEEERSRFRVALWRTVTDDQQWKQHLSDLVALSEVAATTSPGTRAAAAQAGDKPIQRVAGEAMPTIPPFPEFNLGNGAARFPGSLPSQDATLLERIHKRLRSSVSHHPDRFEKLVCRAVQQCYDLLKQIYGRTGAFNNHVLEEALPENAFEIALECGWLPKGARADNPEWLAWIRELVSGRFSRAGFGDSRKPDPYLFVPFPVEADTSKRAPESLLRGGSTNEGVAGVPENTESLPTDPINSSNQQALPALSREALARIAQAEKDARKRYDEDKVPYFPTNPDFSFFEGDIVRSRSRILEYLRLFWEAVLDAHLREYQAVAPMALLTNSALLESVVGIAWTLTEPLWVGYAAVLFHEPSARRARFGIELAQGNQHQEMETWRYPDSNQWAASWPRLTEPGSEMAHLNARFKATFAESAAGLIQQYKNRAAANTSSAETTAGVEARRMSDDAPDPIAKVEDIAELEGELLAILNGQDRSEARKALQVAEATAEAEFLGKRQAENWKRQVQTPGAGFVATGTPPPQDLAALEYAKTRLNAISDTSLLALGDALRPEGLLSYIKRVIWSLCNLCVAKLEPYEDSLINERLQRHFRIAFSEWLRRELITSVPVLEPEVWRVYRERIAGVSPSPVENPLQTPQAKEVAISANARASDPPAPSHLSERDQRIQEREEIRYGNTDRIPEGTDLAAWAERNDLCGQYLPKIAVSRGVERQRLLCELVSKLFGTIARRRVALVNSLADISVFDNEQKTYLGWVVETSLPDLSLDDLEKQAIELTIAGCRRGWLGAAIKRVTGGEAQSSVNDAVLQGKEPEKHGDPPCAPETSPSEMAAIMARIGARIAEAGQTAGSITNDAEINDAAGDLFESLVDELETQVKTTSHVALFSEICEWARVETEAAFDGHEGALNEIRTRQLGRLQRFMEDVALHFQKAESSGPGSASEGHAANLSDPSRVAAQEDPTGGKGGRNERSATDTPVAHSPKPPVLTSPKTTPRRTPDLQSSRERLDLVTALARELATIKQELVVYCTAEGLKQKHPEFILWKHIDEAELRELADGIAFTPKAYAETLTLRKFGITSRETLKKDRKKLRKAQRNQPSPPSS
jgi:hypothetical protein